VGTFFHILKEGIRDFRGSLFPFELEPKFKRVREVLVIITTYDNKGNLALKMLLSKSLAQLMERRMRWLEMRIGKKGIFEKLLLAFQREQG
jgi:hypothetical protein